VQRSRLTTSLIARHVPHAATVAAGFSQSQGGRSVSSIPHYVSLDFAYATRSVLYVMCAIMGFAGLVALVALKRGLQETSPEEGAVPEVSPTE
jgi:hypothetical protein